MAAVTELGYVVFGVSDLAAWRAFAAELLGLEVCEEANEPGRLYLRTDYWHHRIVLEADGTDDLNAAGLRVAGAEELDALRARLVEAGIAFEEGGAALSAARRVLDLIRLRDPAGNPLEIFHGPLIEPHKPFHPGRRMHGRFATGDHGGVGHMILRHAGLDAMQRFYRLLGMRGGLEYRIPTPDGVFDILFMHCNQRDHSLAFGPPSTKSVNHLMLEVENIDDLFMTHELVKASPYPILISLGKHANDHVLSFYFASPSGFLIEVGHGGRPATHQSEYYVRDTYGHEFSEHLHAGMSLG